MLACQADCPELPPFSLRLDRPIVAVRGLSRFFKADFSRLFEQACYKRHGLKCQRVNEHGKVPVASQNGLGSGFANALDAHGGGSLAARATDSMAIAATAAP
jgi:hypothetical protein